MISQSIALTITPQGHPKKKKSMEALKKIIKSFYLVFFKIIFVTFTEENLLQNLIDFINI